MAQYLIHVHSGPDLVNKATLALLVARTAVAEGHAVGLFFGRRRHPFAELQSRWRWSARAPVICLSI